MGAGVIEKFLPRILQGGSKDDPVVLTDTRAVLECGCAGWVGFRTDKAELVAVLRPCTPKHDRRMQIVQSALIDSLGTAPSDRPLIEIVDELLSASTAVA